MYKISALAQNVGGFPKYRRKMYAANVCGKCRGQMLAANVCGKCMRQMYAANVCGNCMRQMLAAKLCGIMKLLRHIEQGGR